MAENVKTASYNLYCAEQTPEDVHNEYFARGRQEAWRGKNVKEGKSKQLNKQCWDLFTRKSLVIVEVDRCEAGTSECCDGEVSSDKGL